jgi:hypothetical protein
MFYVLFLILLVFLGSVEVKHLLKKPITIIRNSPGTSTIYYQDDTSITTFNEGIYSINLPSDWVYKGRDTGAIYNPYIFENTSGTTGSRVLDVYVDRLPTSLGVDLLLPVSASANHITIGTLSGKCTDFTSSDKSTNANGTLARWSGINFICDTSNSKTDVVGTSSSGAINSITLTSPTEGYHSFFFTYTDTNSQPDYSIFTDAVASFTLK